MSGIKHEVALEIVCGTCRRVFTWSVQEQRNYHNGESWHPRWCPGCRAIGKRRRGDPLDNVVADANSEQRHRRPETRLAAPETPQLKVNVIAATQTDARLNSLSQLTPSHRLILQSSRWLGYVEANIDIIEYYPWQAFNHPNGPAVGLAHHWQGKRLAQIATDGRDDISIVATIVHEAAHLAGVTKTGTYFNEEVAVAVERLFLRDVHSLRQ